MVIGTIFVLKKTNFLNGRQLTVVFIMLSASICISFLIGWDPLLKRLISQDSWHETQIEEPNTQENITYETLLPPPPYEMDLQLFLITDSRNVKFRKGYLKSVLYKNGNLKIELYNEKTKSSINTIFTNLSEHLDKGKLTLAISRRPERITVLANKQQLFGKENSSGKKPPSWEYPIIPNEVYVNKRADIKTGGPNLDCRLLSIQPTPYKETDPNEPRQSVKIDFTRKWDLAKLISLSSARNRIYEDSWNMAKDFRWLGCGAGTWATVYFLYHDADEAWDAWAHCDWLEYWITFGLFGAIPGLMLTGLTMLPIRTQTELISAHWLRIGLNLAICGCLLHALFDFPLQVISIMHLFVILCAIKMVTAGKPQSNS